MCVVGNTASQAGRAAGGAGYTYLPTIVFLHSPPDHVGYMENETLRMGFARYLGQPCPIIAPLVGRYFGQRGQLLDKYGRNLAAAALPGQGHRALHNAIQHNTLLRNMILFYAILYYSLLYHIIIYYTILYCIVLYYTIS